MRRLEFHLSKVCLFMTNYNERTVVTCFNIESTDSLKTVFWSHFCGQRERRQAHRLVLVALNSLALNK